MPFYIVRCDLDPEPYPCGQHSNAEDAIRHFNAEYGRKVGKIFTTQGTGITAGCVLIEQERGSDGRLHDVLSIALYEKP